MRILIVEDEAALRDQLTRPWARPATRSTARPTASAPISSRRPSTTTRWCSISGCPSVDGLTLLRRWRDAGLTVPVLVLTARGAWHEKVQGIDSGADDYVAKPFRIEEVLARLRALIRRASGQAAGDAALRPADARSAAARVTLNGTAGAADQPRVPRARVSDAPPRPRRLAGELVEHIYAQDVDRDSNTVEVFIARLRRKLGAVDHRDRARPGLSHGGRRREARLAALAAAARARASGRSGCCRRRRRHRPRSCSSDTRISRAISTAPRTRTRTASRCCSRCCAWWSGCWQVRRGLTSGRAAAARLAAVRDGRARPRRGRYPSEVQPLVDDLNALLEHREAAVARAIAKAGDLAHGLKTPLAVLRRKPDAFAPPATPSWPQRSTSRSIACGGRPNTTWRRRARRRRASIPGARCAVRGRRRRR